MTAPEGTPAPTLPDLCRAAATAIETLCATLRDCAREVEARGGQRVARGRLGKDKQRVDEALWALRCAAHGPLRQEPHEMWQGVVDGYVRPTWALRLMQLAAGAEGPRDTTPSPTCVVTENGHVTSPDGHCARGCGFMLGVGDWAKRCPLEPRDTVPAEAPESPWGDGCPGRVPEGPYKGCVCTLKGKHAQCEAWETRGGEMFLLSSWVPQAPEEHAGEGGT